MRDLQILVADKNMEHAIRGLLGRPEALGIRANVTWDLAVHPRRDPGCLNEAHQVLRPFLRSHAYALVLFDHSGCGRETIPPDSLANEVKQRLAENGWPDRAEAIVLAPELEVWVWSHSLHVPTCLGWHSSPAKLRERLEKRGDWPAGCPKPPHPKEALEAVLRQVHKPKSSAIYLALAEQVSLEGHTEPAFVRLKETLQRWFPA